MIRIRTEQKEALLAICKEEEFVTFLQKAITLLKIQTLYFLQKDEEFITLEHLETFPTNGTFTFYESFPLPRASPFFLNGIGPAQTKVGFVNDLPSIQPGQTVLVTHKRKCLVLEEKAWASLEQFQKAMPEQLCAMHCPFLYSFVNTDNFAKFRAVARLQSLLLNPCVVRLFGCRAYGIRKTDLLPSVTLRSSAILYDDQPLRALPHVLGLLCDVVELEVEDTTNAYELTVTLQQILTLPLVSNDQEAQTLWKVYNIPAVFVTEVKEDDGWIESGISKQMIRSKNDSYSVEQLQQLVQLGFKRIQMKDKEFNAWRCVTMECCAFVVFSRTRSE